MSAKTIRLTIAGASGRHDLVVPADSTVSELLAVGGIDLRRYVGTTTSGAAIDLDSEVSATPGDGGVIWLFDRTLARPGREAGTPTAGDRSAARRQSPLLVALLILAAAILIGCAVLSPTPMVIVSASVVLLLGTVALIALPVRDSTVFVAYFAPFLGGAAGAVALSGFQDAGAMMAAGTVVGATIACIRQAQARVTGQVATATTAVIAVLWSVVAVMDAAAFIAGIPALTITAVHIACAVPVFHYVRAAAFDVAPDDLIDTPFVLRDAQGLRHATPDEPADVHADAATEQYLLARRRSDAGILVACAIALLSALYMIPSAVTPSVETWCILGGAFGAGCYFLLTSRTLRSGVSRAAAVVTGTVLAVLAASSLIIALQVSGLLVALVLVLAGILVGCLTVPFARDWRSLGWSRTGDIFEGVLLALAPAALLYGSGVAGQILEVFS